MYTEEDILDGDIEFNMYGPTISSSDDAMERKYRLLTGKSGVSWVVAIQNNAAENIYKDGGPGSDGMGGRTLTFELEDGSEVSFKGPWSLSAGELFKDTGYDVRGQIWCQGIVAAKRLAGPFYKPDLYKDILHFDDSPILQAPSNIEVIADSFAQTLGKPVFYAYRTKGGGCAGRTKEDFKK